MKFENIDAIVAAVIADDPDAAVVADSLRRSLQEYNEGKVRISFASAAAIRQNANLSQNQFADALGISVNTLRSWEQGLRRPSGSARVLLNLLAKRPELIHEIAD